MQPDFSKMEMKELRLLSGAAYDRELANALSDLETQFRRWRAGETSPFELSEEIHRFHDGVSRDLWNMYGNLKPHLAVARAIATGLVKETDVSAKVRSKLEPTIDFMRQDQLEPGSATENRELE